QFPRHPQAANPVTYLYVAVGSDRNFETVLLGTFGKAAEAAPHRPREVKRAVLGPLTFDNVEWDDEKASYSANFLPNSTPPLAFVFRTDKGRLAEASGVIDLSLRSLAIGSEADGARAAYERYQAGK